MDEADYGNERAQQMLQAAIEEHQYQLSHAVSAFEIGRCRNCDDKIGDDRSYCDQDCRNDHQDRLRAEKRNGKYRGG